ncbi:hypothetical protein HanRHA438_Chr03g0149211 [Helianthus annuus]|nr:hypothetical protein HanOQP8_Chr03g0126711 [Helianthus annuus]KAJ0938101.1 hypothetical protein HanRHA438_Chr03g0149211 [Helianthus annuus]
MPAAGMPLKCVSLSRKEDDGGEVLVGKPLVGGGGRWRKTMMGEGCSEVGAGAGGGGGPGCSDECQGNPPLSSFLPY